MCLDKSIYFQIPKVENKGFVLQYDHLDHFYYQLHHHPELQLIYIIEGTGNLFIGDSVTSIEPGKLFLFGPNQSHLLKSDPKYFNAKCREVSRSISIFFNEDSLGEGFFDLPETEIIKSLFKKADHNMEFSTEIAKNVGIRMKYLLDQTGFERLLEILSILNTLSQTSDYKLLVGISEKNPYPNEECESERIKKIIDYIFEHYKENISLEQIAEIANYSQAAFCRFFKQRTRKTFIQFLNEVRITEACRLLRTTNMNISEICYDCGFNNIPNFNRQFKKITGTTPKNYLKKFKTLSPSTQVIEYVD